MISKESVQHILDTLPIGYYINRNVDATLSDKDVSYYDPMNDKVFVSYPTVANITTNDLLEKDIRCILYHEISHAFLTPKHMQVTDIINVFEDERIESILRHYYKDVDFRNFVIKLNKFCNQKPASSFEMFYQVVRFRCGPQQFVDRVHDIICTYKHLNRSSKCTYDYEDAIMKLYNDIDLYFTYQHEMESKNNQQIDNSSISQTTENNIDRHDDNSDIDEIIDKSKMSEILSNIADEYNSEEISTDIDKILVHTKKINASNGSAINAYSGIFNPRSVIRDDYKYFVQKNRSGHVKAFSKMHLNLFIDCSGSFSSNDLIVNKILKALLRFEKQDKDFSFDLISCGDGQHIRNKNDRVQHSNEGTYLDEHIYEQFRKMQFRDANNINIVLYDGDAFARNWGRTTEKEIKRFSVFNNKNTILITDQENERYVKKYCQNTKVIVTDNYTAELYKNVINSLNILTKF